MSMRKLFHCFEGLGKFLLRIPLPSRKIFGLSCNRNLQHPNITPRHDTYPQLSERTKITLKVLARKKVKRGFREVKADSIFGGKRPLLFE